MTGLLAPPPLNTSTASTVVEFAHHADHKTYGPHLKRGFQSVFIVAMVLCAALNMYLSFAAPIEFDQYKFVYKGWAWWILDDLRNHPDVHNVAILGSSLTVSATNTCDANYLNKRLDLSSYHKAAYFDNVLSSKFGGTFNTFNLSSPGQMPSDAFMMLKAMVNTADRPEVVIYGVAPRDFLDSTLSSPIDTEPFKYLRRLVNLDDVWSMLFRTPDSKLDYWLQKCIYFYQNAVDFEMAFSETTKALFDRILPASNKYVFTWWDRVRLLPSYKPAEIISQAVMIAPLPPGKSYFRDNSREYIERYHRPDPHTYNVQFYFLKKLAEYCRREKIELIIVNMPLTKYNMMLLKPQTYFNYVQALTEFSFSNNVQFFDLSHFNVYGISDYHDSVHLNAFGGKKFFNDLVQNLAVIPRTSSAMRLAGEELKRHQIVLNEDKKRHQAVAGALPGQEGKAKKAGVWQ